MKLSTLLLVAAGFVATTACKKEEKSSNIVQVTATMDSNQQVPTNPSTGTGTFVGTYDKTTRLLSFTVTYAGFTPAAGHIHQGAPGVNGPKMYELPDISRSPVSGSTTLSEADGKSLVEGNGYFNFHSQAYPNGELRGNLMVN